jgi:hypothetical protein
MARDTDSLDYAEDVKLSGSLGTINMNFVKAILTFIIFMLLQSDVFITRVLSKVDGTVEGMSVTTYGTFIQAILLVVILFIFDMIVDHS